MDDYVSDSQITLVNERPNTTRQASNGRVRCGSLLLDYGASQHIGKRNEQQDAYQISADGEALTNERGFALVVADGMGGMKMGREMGQATANCFIDMFETASVSEDIPEFLKEIVEKTNEYVCRVARKESVEGQAGSTLVAVVIRPEGAYWVSVGDSRLYLFRRNDLFQVSVDHNYGLRLNRMVLEGRITSGAADVHPEKDHLISFMGYPGTLLIDRNVKPFPLEKGDSFLLCSDGLYDSVTEAEMKTCLALDAEQAAEQLASLAAGRNKRGQDNLTALVVRVEDNVEIS